MDVPRYAAGSGVAIFASGMHVVVKCFLLVPNLFSAVIGRRLRDSWHVHLILILVASISFGCESSDPDSPPEVLAQFIELMARAEGDEQALRDAFALLAEDAQTQLIARAEQARTLSGGDFEGWQMLIPGRTRPGFPVARHGAFRTEVQGNLAHVTVTGVSKQSAVVPLTRERGEWRIVIHVPHLSPGS